jgi:hypothetical protein
MCGGKKSAPAQPQEVYSPPSPGYKLDSGGVIRDARGPNEFPPGSVEQQPASFGAELGAAQ